MNSRTQGFTLLELSIVLVIIGLLIGGIFVGQSLIHTAQLNAVVSEFNRYQTATQNFRMQYQGLPGDMTNATSFWGIAGGTGADATCINTASTTTATCNGNGDGLITTNLVANDEPSRAWQHLVNAKMIEGSYPGNPVTPPIVGVSIPASRMDTLGWKLSAYTNWTGGGSGWFNTDYGTGNILRISSPSSAGITPKDSWTIDKKIDDGKPGTGNVIVQGWSTCTNAANNADLTATYTLTAAANTPTCALFFLTSF